MLPLSFSLKQSATSGSKLGQEGASWAFGNDSDWNVNIGGSGTSYQAASSAPPSLAAPLTIPGVSVPPLALLAIALGVVWLLKR